MTEPEVKRLRELRAEWRFLAEEVKKSLEQQPEAGMDVTTQDVTVAYRSYVQAFIRHDEFLLDLAEQAARPL